MSAGGSADYQTAWKFVVVDSIWAKARVSVSGVDAVLGNASTGATGSTADTSATIQGLALPMMSLVQSDKADDLGFFPALALPAIAGWVGQAAAQQLFIVMAAHATGYAFKTFIEWLDFSGSSFIGDMVEYGADFIVTKKFGLDGNVTYDKVAQIGGATWDYDYIGMVPTSYMVVASYAQTASAASVVRAAWTAAKYWFARSAKSDDWYFAHDDSSTAVAAVYFKTFTAWGFNSIQEIYATYTSAVDLMATNSVTNSADFTLQTFDVYGYFMSSRTPVPMVRVMVQWCDSAYEQCFSAASKCGEYGTACCTA
jgi:hypothetical protein